MSKLLALVDLLDSDSFALVLQCQVVNLTSDKVFCYTCDQLVDGEEGFLSYASDLKPLEIKYK